MSEKVKRDRCPHCGGAEFWKTGRQHGSQLFQCVECRRSFQEWVKPKKIDIAISLLKQGIIDRDVLCSQVGCHIATYYLAVRRLNGGY